MKSQMAMIAIVTVLLACGVSVSAEEITAVSLKTLLTKVIEKHEHPGGMGVLVVHDGKIKAQATAGKRHHRKENLITDQDLFHLGSCTKAMTGTLIGLAVQRGELKFDSTLGELLADWEIHNDFKTVTVKQLLHHRSGLKANASVTEMLLKRAVKDEQGKIKQRRDVLQPVLKEAPEYAPDTNDTYSNLGYILLGHLLERQSGKAWETLMREQIFEPLGMKSAGFGPVKSSKNVTQPYGHVRNAMKVPAAVEGDNPPFLGPAGTVHASLEDWSKFIVAHFSAESNPLGLTEETLKALHTPGPDRYAAGWVIFFPNKPEPVLFHNGSNTMWYCAVCFIPTRKEAVLVTSNAFEQKPVHEVMKKLLSIPIQLEP